MMDMTLTKNMTIQITSIYSIEIHLVCLVRGLGGGIGIGRVRPVESITKREK